ncbi:MAG: YcxB family protein [Pseudomonadota bacterium]
MSLEDTLNPYAAPGTNVANSADHARALGDTLALTVQLTRKDWYAYQQFWSGREIGRPLPLVSVAALGLLWLSVISVLISVAREPLHLSSLAALGLLLAGIFHFAVTQLRKRRALQPAYDGVFLGQHRFEFSEAGVRDISIHCDSLTRWHVVSSIDESEELVVIGLSQVGAFVLPKRYLDNPPQFVHSLKALRAAVSARDERTGEIDQA